MGPSPLTKWLAAGAALVLILGISGCGDGGDGTSPASETSAATTAPPSTTIAEHTEAERAAFAIRPVLGTGPCPPPVTTSTPDAEGTVSGETTATSAPAVGSTPEPGEAGSIDDDVPTVDRRFCYRLGPAAVDGNDLTDATVSSNEGLWQVFVRVRSGSLTALNEFMNGCFAGVPTCPAAEGGHGSVAFVWDGEVLYSTAVTTEDIGDGGLLLAGGQTERRARDLLALINR